MSLSDRHSGEYLLSPLTPQSKYHVCENLTEELLLNIWEENMPLAWYSYSLCDSLPGGRKCLPCLCLLCIIHFTIMPLMYIQGKYA